MTTIRYLVQETLRSQLAILSTLFLISFCQKLVRILDAAVDGDISVDLVFSLLGLGVPEMTQLILPLSPSLGLLVTLGKPCTKGKITVTHACGLGKAVLVKAVTVLASFTSIITATNMMWAGPQPPRHQDEALAKAEANPSTVALTQGQFQQVVNGSSVLFIENVDGSNSKDVFLVQIRPEGNARPSVVVVDSGHLTQMRDGSQVVMLNQGVHFEDTTLLCDFRITDFQGHQAIIGHRTVALDPDDANQMNMRTLWATDTDRARAELIWHIMLVFTVFMMALMVIPLSAVNPRQGRMLSMLPAMLLYLLLFLVQTSLKSNGSKGKLDPVLWMWTVNLTYLAPTIMFNPQDTVPMYRLYANLMHKGAV